MSIIVCGVNHKTAPIDLREQMVFAIERLPLYLADLANQAGVTEAVILSTCNRSEVYAAGATAEQLKAWFASQHHLSLATLAHSFYVYQDQAAIKHLMRVACGLDSLVVGETEILGQLKQAFSEALAAGTVNVAFNRLFQQVFAVAKEVRTSTAVGACPVSVAGTAVRLLRECYQAWPQAKVLLIGAGDVAQLTARHLRSQGIKEIRIINRHLERAKNLAQAMEASWYEFAALPQLLLEVDIVITATGSMLPILTTELLQKVSKPIWVMDLAVPRDVEPKAGELPQVNLYTIDDLKTMIQQHQQGRAHAASQAEQLIEDKSNQVMRWWQSLDMVNTTIRVFREQAVKVRDLELAKAYKRLQQGVDPNQVLANFAHILTNKLLHNPSVQMRQAGQEGHLEILENIQQLLLLQPLEIEPT